MTASTAELVDITCTPGVQPEADSTAFSTEHYTDSDKIRFVDGYPEKIGGWVSVAFANSATIQGTCRSVYSATINGRVITMIGTHKKLYSIIGNTLTNITPLDVDTIAIADSLATRYDTLPADPLAIVNGSNVVTVTDPDAVKFRVGDTITLSGATTVGNVLAAALNTQHVIRSIGSGFYTFRTGTVANVTVSGGGAVVERGCGLITVTAPAHGQAEGDRVKVTGAADTGGILAAEINREYLIRNVAAGAFDVMTDGFSSSAVAAGGGAGVEYQQEIPEGALDESFGQGYGMGQYGAGLYGISKISTQAKVYPRIWFFDRFGNTIIMTPGNQTGLYQWDGDNTEAPSIVAGAPDEINYVFCSDSIVMTFGAGVDNKLFGSDQNGITQWVASATNQVFEDEIEGAGRLVSHCQVNGINLIFTDTQTYILRYIGNPLIWATQIIEPNIGIIGPMARVVTQGTAYWMDDNNFYQCSSGNVEILGSNTKKNSTILNHVFGDLTASQRSKIFAWHNVKFNEIWWHYISAAANEPDRVARFNIADKTWVPDTMNRTAAEYPNTSLLYPRLINTSILYKHETGYDADTEAMPFRLVTNLRNLGRNVTNQDGIIPDSTQSGTINFRMLGYEFPQSTTPTNDKTVDITQTTERVPTVLSGRFWLDSWTGNELGQNWRMGKWQEYVQKGSAN